MKYLKLLSFLLLIVSSGLLQAQEIDPDTGQVIDTESKEKEEDVPLTKQEKNKEKVLDRMVKIKSRHKPWRIRTAFNTTEFGDIDISELPIASNFLIAFDIPTFTLYKDLYLGFSAFGSVNMLDEESVDISTTVVYGGNLNLNYSVKIIDGLYVVPLVGYGYLGITESEYYEPEFDPIDGEIFNDDPVFEIENSQETALNYGVFLDFSFNLRPKGIGITAGYTNYSKFTFGIQYGL